MIRWTGLALWELEFPFPGSLMSTFLAGFLAADHLPEDGEGCEQADALVDFIAHDLARYLHVYTYEYIHICIHIYMFYFIYVYIYIYVHR